MKLLLACTMLHCWLLLDCTVAQFRSSFFILIIQVTLNISLETELCFKDPSWLYKKIAVFLGVSKGGWSRSLSPAEQKGPFIPLSHAETWLSQNRAAGYLPSGVRRRGAMRTRVLWEESQGKAATLQTGQRVKRRRHQPIRHDFCPRRRWAIWGAYFLICLGSVSVQRGRRT